MIKRLCVLLAAALVITSTAKAYVNDKIIETARDLGATTFSEVKFGLANSRLTEDQKKDLTSAIAAARLKGDIKKVKVLAWADKEYPKTQTKHDPADTELADNRAYEIKKYLKDNLAVSTVDTFNMTQRPSRIEKVLNTKDVQLKKQVEDESATEDMSKNSAFALRDESSKVLILVYLKR
jgi:hypothetical protein